MGSDPANVHHNIA